MVQQVITLCDVCAEDDEAGAATSHLVAVAGGTWSLDLCEPHYAALVAPLAEVAERLGQVVKGAGKVTKATAAKAEAKAAKAKVDSNSRPTNETCLLCGHHAPTTGSLLLHIRTRHEVGLEALYGSGCPVCGREFASATALGVHVSRSHTEVAEAEGAASVPAAFRYAAEHGDPYDIVAKMLAGHGLTALPPKAAA